MSSPADQASTAPQSTPHQQTSGSRPQSRNEPPSTGSVEMKTLEASGAAPAPTDTTTHTTDAPAVAPAATPAEQPVGSSTSEDAPVAPSSPGKLAPPSALNRADTEAIGPSTDTPAANPDNTNGPVLVIMLLLTSGARHPYKIDEKYLKKRSVKVENMDPYNISVYTLKELIWRDWREEWEARPTSPGSIRLIHFGRMLDDKSPLKECRFQTDTPNVVHMTVKPQEVVDEEENAKTGKSGNRRESDDEPTATCRCVIL
ncbi:hypothetical protein COCC4DRAFT_161734 [Bipolaris maydis ATCC 48331]|uniref:UBL3-like ubiquitin domain-containing protein n=2 Tax=Cochliobolus heterostrophus TaxID=5016 RepID=M2UCF1_COCH5|nr:uncharacterized protein COCC4DRAFT_161734 [Bipolaris maydis ATCC 48331]EMD91346.1 hypothetical protein COCHEDRAFT_1021405 [Bipolaris maydis C5]KAJ5027451.1 ubiquitin-related domain-containing protein [Bipolaris maydis]ENI08896.1 hypothetical protein COCC4DRAFT_161734 [Bipolaris maydis ATCC 48331]KAJ5058763.1 ubiquitin-related domain-containing protein [Bipolaris maydis]KAJ6202362.1 ubiquitin-related domain-containing protein [Bipolaris maydis]